MVILPAYRRNLDFSAFNRANRRLNTPRMSVCVCVAGLLFRKHGLVQSFRRLSRVTESLRRQSQRRRDYASRLLWHRRAKSQEISLVLHGNEDSEHMFFY